MLPIDILSGVIAPGLWYFQYLAYSPAERANPAVRTFLAILLMAAVATVITSIAIVIDGGDSIEMRLISLAGMGILLLPFLLSIFARRKDGN